jgi:hypothetical protein
MSAKPDSIEQAMTVLWGKSPKLRDFAKKMLRAAETESDMALKQSLASFHLKALPKRVTDKELNDSCDKIVAALRKVISDHA